MTQILPHIAGLRTDEQLQQFLQRWRSDTVLVNFGSSWCHHCHQMFPHFLSLSKRFPQLKYAVAQVDYMHEETRGITYTPTFAVYKKGRKVDQFFGANEQQLRDHMWLWTQQADGQDGGSG
ncbi:Thioredoxin-like 3-3 [Chlorella sorokiniana]|uniref:Thioredoxin-like 3-3 n=1 Tax=Chlorella sorokiniana TaxID=3076 RepID=A0A2P6TW75_CHLSO|nr:Thioredoxin-like 3-3 [Chlorella sorokiniana]|eukprot:PRW58311.1 Thioredoxin-like 3-3 [Chlorella sorokiniana]